MSFADELNEICEKAKKNQEQEKANRTREITFINDTIKEIQERCKSVAKKNEHTFYGYLHWDDGERKFISSKPLSGKIHLFCCPEEDDNFIVQNLKSRLLTLGFKSVSVSISYENKVEEKMRWKQSLLLGHDFVYDKTITPNYYKYLYISCEW